VPDYKRIQIAEVEAEVTQMIQLLRMEYSTGRFQVIHLAQLAVCELFPEMQEHPTKTAKLLFKYTSHPAFLAAKGQILAINPRSRGDK